MCLLLCHRLVICPTRDNKEFTLFYGDLAFLKPDQQASLYDQEELVFLLVPVPDKFPEYLRQLDMLPIQGADYPRAPEFI